MRLLIDKYGIKFHFSVKIFYNVDMSSPKRILITTLEASGDLHAAHLIRALKKILPNLQIFGVGGENMKAAGATLIGDASKKGVVGLVETLPYLPSLLFAGRRVTNFLDKETPDALLCIDSQGFNVMVAEAAKKRGIKTIYYVAPQEWLWGSEKNVKKIANAIDLIIAIFEKEKTSYQNAGGNVFFHGHPLLDIVKPTKSKEDFCKNYGLNPKAPIVALFFGNRKQEVKNLLPIFLKTAALIKEKMPGCQFVAPLFSPVFKKRIQTTIKKLMPGVILVKGENYNLINAADAVISTPGTVTLESAILETPVVAVYNIHPLTYLIAERVLKLSLPYFTMPSLLVNHLVVPEYIQKDARPEKIADEVVDILLLPSRREHLSQKLKEVKKHLGHPGAIQKAAEKIAAFLT